MKLKNVKDWKTTLTALIGGVIMIAGVLWPQKIDPQTMQVLNEGTAQIITGIGAIIPVIALLFAKDE
jgi:hypothetical protein